MFHSKSHVATGPTPLGGRVPRLPRLNADRRADGQVRSVSLSRDVVRIDRQVQGILMRVAVPVRGYRGVALSLQPDQDGSLSYRLELLHSDGDLSVTLDEAWDDSDILADWRLWSRFFGLPALVERNAGLIEEADVTLGSLLLGAPPVARRRLRSASKRRPRFLLRRKIGVPDPAAPVILNEYEIIARD